MIFPEIVLLHSYPSYVRLVNGLISIWRVLEGDPWGAYCCYFLNLLIEAYENYLADQSRYTNRGSSTTPVST